MFQFVVVFVFGSQSTRLFGESGRDKVTTDLFYNVDDFSLIIYLTSSTEFLGLVVFILFLS